MNQYLDLSIFIRAKNEEPFIKRCLGAIFSQSTQKRYEVIILDSGSTDRTVIEASMFPVTIYSIPGEKFDYSSALNFGLKASKGGLFVSLSAHAIPANDNWLEELIKPLEIDSLVCGSYSRQIPWPDVSTPEAVSIAKSFPEQPSRINESNFHELLKQGEEPFEIGKFSNVSSCIRREVLQTIPYRKLPFAEDRCFAVEALSQGFSIAYAAGSVVYHSHPPSFSDYLKVAKNATIARRAINSLVNKDSMKSELGLKFNALFRLFCYFPILIINLILFSRSKRAATFWVASLGTSLGKLLGLKNIGGARLLDFADPSEIYSIAKVLHEPKT